MVAPFEGVHCLRGHALFAPGNTLEGCCGPIFEYISNVPNARRKGELKMEEETCDARGRWRHVVLWEGRLNLPGALTPGCWPMAADNRV